MASVMISCREMKLELTTVTSQPNQPMKPTVHSDGNHTDQHRQEDPVDPAEDDRDGEHQQQEYRDPEDPQVALDEADHVVGDHADAAQEQGAVLTIPVHDRADGHDVLVVLSAALVAVLGEFRGPPA